VAGWAGGHTGVRAPPPPRALRGRLPPLLARPARTAGAEARDALGIRRYSQLHTADTPFTEAIRASRGCEPSDYDGVALVWFDSLDALGAAASSSEGQAAGAALLEDERRFLDLERCLIWLTDDHPVVEA
jgi:hypothetical protein